MLTLPQTLPIEAHNGGLFVSRGTGTHPDRTISSHELIVVRTGTLGIQEEQQIYSIGAGDTLLLFPNRRHFGTRPYGTDLSFYWFHFDVGITTSSEPPLPVPSYSRGSGEELMALCRRFLDIQTGGENTSAFRRSLLLLEMFAAIVSRTNSALASRVDDAGVRLADRADALLRVRFAEIGLSTQTIAETLEVNPDYLGRVFRRAFGKPITEALHVYRLRYARSLLLDDSKNIAEIAAASGFTDAGYFRRVFKRYVAVSPQSFRRLHARAYVNTQ